MQGVRVTLEERTMLLTSWGRVKTWISSTTCTPRSNRTTLWRNPDSERQKDDERLLILNIDSNVTNCYLEVQTVNILQCDASPVRRKRTVYCLPLAACVLMAVTWLYRCPEETTIGPPPTGFTLPLVRNVLFTSSNWESVAVSSPHCEGTWRDTETPDHRDTAGNTTELKWAQDRILRDATSHSSIITDVLNKTEVKWAQDRTLREKRLWKA